MGFGRTTIQATQAIARTVSANAIDTRTDAAAINVSTNTHESRFAGIRGFYSILRIV
jgi:hypothetical protein